jgi:hypothetical protein
MKKVKVKVIGYKGINDKFKVTVEFTETLLPEVSMTDVRKFFKEAVEDTLGIRVSEVIIK